MVHNKFYTFFNKEAYLNVFFVVDWALKLVPQILVLQCIQAEKIFMTYPPK